LTVFTHKWESTCSCDLNIIVKCEGLLKVTGSHIHWKSDNTSEMMLDKDVVTTGYQQEVILVSIWPV